MALQSGDLVLCSGTLRRGLPFQERLAAASAAGFAGVSLWGRDYQEARDSGLSDGDLRAMLNEYGLSVAEMDLAWWWLPGADAVQIPPAFDDQDIFRFKERDVFAMAEALEARSINAVDVFGGDWGLEEAAASFSALCRRAADHGLLVHVEFLPWSRIPDLATAWSVVRDADEPNGGIALDAWHYFRSSPDDELLRAIPGDRIVALQLNDAPAVPEPDLPQATLHDRLLPGEGDLDLDTLLASLRSIGTNAPIGVEVFSDALRLLPPMEVARLAGDAVRRVLARA